MRCNQENTIQQAAAGWYLRRQACLHNQQTQQSFNTWLVEDPRHQAAYHQIELTMADFNSTIKLMQLSDAMRQKRYFERNSERFRRSKLSLLMIFLLISIAVVCGVHHHYLVWKRALLSEQTQITGVGEIAERTLDDHSVIITNANTTLNIRYYRNRRDVQFDRGEAIFDFIQERRPFAIQTALARLSGNGNRFAINQWHDRMRISVERGPVYLKRNTPGTAGIVIRDGQVVEMSLRASPQRLARKAADGFGFENGRITFDHADMFEVAETLSRYRRQPVSALFFGSITPRISAVLSIWDTEKFLSLLPSLVPVNIESQPDTVVIQPQA